MLPSLKEDRRKKGLTTTPLFTYTHTQNERLRRWLDGGQIGGRLGWWFSFTSGTRKWRIHFRSYMIPFGPARSLGRARAHSSERMQCYLSLLLSNKLRLILRKKRKVSKIRYVLRHYIIIRHTQRNGKLLESSALLGKSVSTVVMYSLWCRGNW